MEDYYAKTRNGHELNDFYDRESNTLDIRSNGLYPSNVLSNLCRLGYGQGLPVQAKRNKGIMH